MVAAAEDGACEVGHGKANEHDESAEGSDDGHEDATTDDDHHEGAADVQTLVGGIALAQQHQVHVLYQQAGQRLLHAH